MIYKEGVERQKLDLGLRVLLADAEGRCSFEWVITDGYREGDELCHGVGLAVDIRCKSSNQRFQIVRALFAVGISRIGIYDKHVHADTCVDKLPQDVMWRGVSK